MHPTIDINVVKKKISLFFVSLSALLMFAISAVPHHHHDGWVHILVGHSHQQPCEQSDQLPGHQRDPLTPDGCAVHSIFEFAQPQQLVKVKVFAHLQTLMFPLFWALLPSHSQLPEAPVFFTSAFRDRQTPTVFSTFSSVCGHRAPPALFS
ncbi:MAG: hypothetical protein H3C41_03965 [Bacteroidales bacterium]|nr:hypothetical protein [Bacteroidales bacterium]